VRFYVSAQQPVSNFTCWEEVSATQIAGVPGTCAVGGVKLGKVWQPGIDYVRAGEFVEVVLVTTDTDMTQYTATVSAKAVTELSPVRSGSPAAARVIQGVKLIELVLGVWTGSNIVTVAVTKPGTDGKAVTVFTDSFAVHRFYRANVTGGFLASTLHTREYGAATVPELDNMGKPVVGGSGTVFVTVPTVGPVRRPQLHPYVGVLWYFKDQDFFPGSESRFRGSWLFGTVADEAQSYITGPSLDTKYGVSFGVGVHYGREQFLAPGVTPGTVPGFDGTHLSDISKTPPTVNRQRVGAYFSVGFDLTLFKSIFGGPLGLK
jgi:hypothetical protein